MVVQENIEDQEVTRKAPKYPITLHISEGNKLSRLAQYEKAISCFDAGLKIQPNNIRCLLGKTKCLMKLCKYEEAKQIAEEIIKLQPRCAEAYTLLGNTEFTKGNFEDGYIAFSSGYRKRPYSLDLRLGYQMCKKALNNSHDSDVPIALDHTDVKEVKNILQNKCKRQNKDDNETCKDICHEIIDIMDKSFDYFTIESLKIKADALHFLGLAYMLGNNTSSALKYHKLQLKIAEDCSAADLKKRSFYDIGEDFLRSGNYEQALTSFRQCMEFVEAKHEEAIVLYKIADCELYLENLKNATKNGRNSLSIATSCHDDRLQCDTTMLLAEIALRKKNMKDAKNLYAEALAVAEESKDSRLDRIKDLINMFHEKLDDRCREESILSFANKMEESRSSLRRMIYIGSIKSKEKYNSRHCNKPSHLQAEESTKIKQLDTDSISSESSNQYIDLNTKNVRNNSNTYEGS
ncbi:uncharacterized protein LOC129974958 [Argiope bruennichi]|uniref:uncharacterized protein LOC129974958 n=1 Tax=Argiope bruennichi TaxID=94029 RepID=UPI002495002C|nr:uncharacterized protein LOC129974958 [Argiope bruennichi]